MKVIILAGGFGTRLQSVVNDVPKPMADINGTPFLELLMTNMLSFGASEFILCVSYMRDKIIDYFGEEFRGVQVKYSVEEEPLGTGGAIKQAFDLFNLDEAVVINGDSFIKMNYADFYQQNKGRNLSIALKFMENANRYGLVENNCGKVVKFNEKSSEVQSGLINAGIYFISKHLWQYAPKEKKFSFEKDILEKYIQKLDASYFQTEDYFIDIGVPESYAQALRELKDVILPKSKALFLDRDGVINIDKHHVYKIEDCEFVEGIFDLCRKYKNNGYKLIVVTNQAGIAKGIYTKEDYFKFRDYVHKAFFDQDCGLDGEYYCPYHPEATIEEYRQNSNDRKPNPGMILRAAKDFNIDLSQSVLIGDKESDIEAGKRTNIGKCIRFIGETNAAEVIKKLKEIK